MQGPKFVHASTRRFFLTQTAAVVAGHAFIPAVFPALSSDGAGISGSAVAAVNHAKATSLRFLITRGPIRDNYEMQV